MFKKINKVVKAYIFWDLSINSALGLMNPIFAIFILQKVATGNVREAAITAGFATLFYWITKLILQMPIAGYLDKNKGEMDDFWFFVAGTLVVGLSQIGFIFSSLPWHIYALQVLYAAGFSMITPSATSIFVRHIDKGSEAYETGLDNTLSGVGIGVMGAIGGVIAGYIGFQFIFILTGFLTLASIPFIFSIKKEMRLSINHNINKLSIEESEKPRIS